MTELNMLTVKNETETDDFFDTFQDKPAIVSQVDCHFDAQEGQYFFDAKTYQVFV